MHINIPNKLIKNEPDEISNIILGNKRYYFKYYNKADSISFIGYVEYIYNEFSHIIDLYGYEKLASFKNPFGAIGACILLKSYAYNSNGDSMGSLYDIIFKNPDKLSQIQYNVGVSDDEFMDEFERFLHESNFSRLIDKSELPYGMRSIEHIQ